MDTVRGGTRQGLVLVIDDEESSQAVARLALQELGFGNVVVVGDGAAALRMLDWLKQPPAYVLCDIFMPDADGIELVNALAARQYRGGLVLVTGGDSQYLVIAKRIARFHGLNLLGCLLKPLSPEALQQALQGTDQA